MRANPAVVNGAPRSEVKTNGDRGSCSRCRRRSARSSSPTIRVRRRRPLLDAADVQGGGCEVDLLPSEIDQLAGPKAVAVGDKQHRGVAVAIAIALRGGEELVDLGLGEVLTRAQLAIWSAGRPNCSIYGGRSDQSETPVCQEFCPM